MNVRRDHARTVVSALTMCKATDATVARTSWATTANLSTMCVDLFLAGITALARAAPINVTTSVSASQVWHFQKLGHKEYCLKVKLSLCLII
jgi:hypothetical protein